MCGLCDSGFWREHTQAPSILHAYGTLHSDVPAPSHTPVAEVDSAKELCSKYEYELSTRLYHLLLHLFEM